MNEQSIYAREVVVPPDTYAVCPENRQKLIEYLIRAGSQAPSWYNCQPWRFEVSSTQDQIDIILDCSRDRSFYDWGYFNSLLACGAAIKNIMIAASGRSIQRRVEYREVIADENVVASIKLGFEQSTEASEVDVKLEKALWTRHTNPLMFDIEQPNADILQALKQSVVDIPGISLHFLTDADDKDKVFGAASCAEQIRFSRRDLHEQLYRMIRWNDREAYSEKTGYTLPSMGVCGYGKSFFRITRPWLMMRIMNFFGAHQNQAKRACQGLIHCGAIGLLTVKGKTHRDLLVAGETMQALWLRATLAGLDLQPHNSIAQFYWAWKLGGAALFSAQEQQILNTAFKRYIAAFPDADLNDGEMGVFLFRIGKGACTYGYTLRKDIG